MLDERVRAAPDLLGKLDDVDTFQDDVVRLHRVGARKRRASQQRHIIRVYARSQSIRLAARSFHVTLFAFSLSQPQPTNF